MSMLHKAYVFDFEAFDTEMRAILEASLISGDTQSVSAFIDAHVLQLSDPTEGTPLEHDWRSKPANDVHQYADIAITKYYDPCVDIGLSGNWIQVQAVLSRDVSLRRSPILGSTVGTNGLFFDPGKMGSYFQSYRQVYENTAYLRSMTVEPAVAHFIAMSIDMLSVPLATRRGLYVTF